MGCEAPGVPREDSPTWIETRAPVGPVLREAVPEPGPGPCDSGVLWAEDRDRAALARIKDRILYSVLSALEMGAPVDELHAEIDKAAAKAKRGLR